MARTKQEVRDFLNSLVGQKVNEKCGIYNGQCVSLIKALLEFLGAPNPYAGRGNAITVGDTLLSQGLAENRKGWLNVCVNRDMGRIFENGIWNNYGHIWLDLGDMNFEQNGAKALYTTKNTRPISQAQQIVNLDQYIKGEDDMITREQYLEGAMAVGTVYGKDFNFDPNRTVDEFIQFLHGQSPRITREMENAVADGITGVKNVVGWDGYNSQFVGKQVVFEYPKMVAYWIDQARGMKQTQGEFVEIPGPVYAKKQK